MRKVIYVALMILGLTAIKSAGNVNTGGLHPNAPAQKATLGGAWVLEHITATPEKTLQERYPTTIPEISFDLAAKRVSGNAGCNTFNGPVKISGRKLDFSEPLAMSRMMCTGDGEKAFTENLKKVTSYKLTKDGKLSLYGGKTELFRFVRKR